MKNLLVLFGLFFCVVLNAKEPSYEINEHSVSVFIEENNVEKHVATVDLKTGDVHLLNRDYDISATVLIYETDYTVAIKTKTKDKNYLYISEKKQLTNEIQRLYMQTRDYNYNYNYKQGLSNTGQVMVESVTSSF